MKKKINVQQRYCEVCGELIHRGTKKYEKRITPKQYSKSRFCSMKCKGVWLSNNNVGSKNSNWRGGKPRCIDCGKHLDRNYKKNSRCRECYTKFNRGCNHWNWRGGITPLIESLRCCVEYSNWRTEVFERDNYTCQICGDNRGGNLNAHHIHMWKNFPFLRFEIDNGITLCKKCHILIHKKK